MKLEKMELGKKGDIEDELALVTSLFKRISSIADYLKLKSRACYYSLKGTFYDFEEDSSLSCKYYQLLDGSKNGLNAL